MYFLSRKITYDVFQRGGGVILKTSYDVSCDTENILYGRIFCQKLHFLSKVAFFVKITLFVKNTLLEKIVYFEKQYFIEKKMFCENYLRSN